MKIIIAALALLALAAAVPLEKETAKGPLKEPAKGPVKEPLKEPVKILRSEHDQSPDGKYSFNYESEDGSARQEEGSPKEVLDEEKKPHTVVVVRGAYSYVDPEGKTDTITYEADEKGYRASGDSIPTPPAPQASSRR